MDIIYTMIFIDMCIIIHEFVNYFVSFKEQLFRTYYVQSKPLDIKTIFSIVVLNDTLYLIFFRAFFEIIGINDLFVLSVLIGFIETAMIYRGFLLANPKFQYMSAINRFIFHTIIYKQLLQLNIIFAIIIHCHIVYICSVIRSNYYHADNFIKTTFDKIKGYRKHKVFGEAKEAKEVKEVKEVRENIYAK